MTFIVAVISEEVISAVKTLDTSLRGEVEDVKRLSTSIP
jgi:hypothetical protein